MCTAAAVVGGWVAAGRWHLAQGGAALQTQRQLCAAASYARPEMKQQRRAAAASAVANTRTEAVAPAGPRHAGVEQVRPHLLHVHHHRRHVLRPEALRRRPLPVLLPHCAATRPHAVECTVGLACLAVGLAPGLPAAAVATTPSRRALGFTAAPALAPCCAKRQPQPLPQASALAPWSHRPCPCPRHQRWRSGPTAPAPGPAPGISAGAMVPPPLPQAPAPARCTHPAPLPALPPAGSDAGAAPVGRPAVLVQL